MDYSALISGFFGTWLLENAKSFAIALAVLALGWFLSRFLARHTAKSLPHTARIDATIAPLLAETVRYGVLVVTIVVALSQFGVQTASMLAVLGAAGLAIALALQGTLSNIASGVMLVWLRPFNVGDYIDAEGTTGTVLEIGLFATQLRTYDGVFIFVPNSKLWNARISNFSREPNRMVEVKIGIAYDSDVGKARDVLLEVARDERVLPAPAPTVHVGTLGAIAVEVVLRAWVKNADWWSTKVALTERCKAALEAAGVRIPYSRIDIAALEEDGG
jgi:small conductance mechanosensitive channel